MNCPYCNHQDHLEIDLHADGFSTDLLECVECGALLTTSGHLMQTVHGPDRPFVVQTAEQYGSVAVNAPQA